MTLTIRKWIENLLIENQMNAQAVYSLYNEAVNTFGYESNFEIFKRFVRKIRFRLMEKKVESNPAAFFEPLDSKNSYTEKGNEATLEIIDEKNIATVEELILSAGVDLNIWEIERQTINNYYGFYKNPEGVAVKVPMRQIKIVLIRKNPIAKIPAISPIIFSPVTKFVPVVVNSPTHIKKTLILSDAHIGYRRDYRNMEDLLPFQDRAALGVCLQIIKENTFDEIIFNGDMLDLAEASQYPQHPEFYNTVQPALSELAYLLYEIRKVAPSTRLVFLAGNHTIRIEKRIQENLRFAYDLRAVGNEAPIYSMRNLLGLDAIGVEYIEKYPSGTHWVNDNFKVKHGEFTKLSKEIEVSNTHTVMGHLHGMETQFKNLNMRNSLESVFAMTSGCLCKIDGTVPGASSRPNWQQGIIYAESVGSLTQANHVHINQGQAIFQGRVYQSKGYTVKFENGIVSEVDFT